MRYQHPGPRQQGKRVVGLSASRWYGRRPAGVTKLHPEAYGREAEASATASQHEANAGARLSKRQTHCEADNAAVRGSQERLDSKSTKRDSPQERKGDRQADQQAERCSGLAPEAQDFDEQLLREAARPQEEEGARDENAGRGTKSRSADNQTGKDLKAAQEVHILITQRTPDLLLSASRKAII